MSHNGFRKCCIVVLALLLCHSVAFAETRMGKPPHPAYAMRVDYNPKTSQLTGLCHINGHPCWLQLDTGWYGVALYADRQADWKPALLGDQTIQPDKKQGNKEQDGKKDTRPRVLLSLEPTNYLQVEGPVEIINDADHFRTSTGQPITGILGIPFLNVIPIEWNVPTHKIVFWLSGRPKQFLHVPRRAVLFCKRDQYHRLIIPFSVRGRHGRMYLDTGADELYVFDYLISDFPLVGHEEEVVGPKLKFRYVMRDVKGLKIGPLTIHGIIGGRVPRHSASNTLYPYGIMGMSIISHLHLFVVGDKIIFDPHAAHFSSWQ